MFHRPGSRTGAPFSKGRGGLFADPVFTEIGSRYGKSAALVVLR